MKVRRQGGATLGLVAACVLLVIVIGVCFYFLSKIIGGGREVANATDAGALNVARQALKRGSVDLSTISYSGVSAKSEFGSLTDPPCTSTVNTPVTLVTYNRIIAQAMMVCKNAQIEGTTNAQTNAQTTATLANMVGAALKNSLLAASTPAAGLGVDFNAISQGNNTKMWNGNPVTCSAITTGYLKQNGSTNVIFDNQIANTFSGWYPGASATVTNNNTPGATDSLGISTGTNPKYMVGYDDPAHLNTFFGGIQLTGVPVFPNTKPHLIDVGTFNNDLATNNAYVGNANVPLNAFNTSSRAVEAKSGAPGASLACAVVGVLNKDYVASLPRGFVRISNGPDAYTLNNNTFGPGTSIPVSDGSNDIFNNQLYTGPNCAPGASGITQSSNTGIFTTTPGYLQAWAAFNARVGTGTSGYDLSITAGVPGPCWVGTTTGNVYPVGAPVPLNDLPTFADTTIVSSAAAVGITGVAGSIQDMAQNPATYDGSNNQDAGLRIGADCGEFAPLIAANNDDLEHISSNTFPCNYTMYNDGVSGNCADVTTVNNWQTNYGQCNQSPFSFATNYMGQTSTTQGVTNVEFMKAELLGKIQGRLGGHYCADVFIPSGTQSGVKYFPRGVPGTPGSEMAFDPVAGETGTFSKVVNFENDASPWAYLSQITQGNSCSSTVVDQITARLQQVSPTVTSSQVQAAMDTQILHLRNSQGPATTDNGILYLFVDPSTHNVTMSANLPNGWTDSTLASGSPSFPASGTSSTYPDGKAATVDKNNGACNDQYPLNGWVVDTYYGTSGNFTSNGIPKGDAHYHDQPFTQPAGDNLNPIVSNSTNPINSTTPGTAPNNFYPNSLAISGQDNATFRPSSGAQNLLGELQFTEDTEGTTFCNPN